MTVESVLVTRLNGFAGLTALVGTRIRPNRAEQNIAKPYITFRRVSADRDSAMGVDVGTVTARFQFDVWAEDFTSMAAVGEQLRLALQRWRNSSGTVVDDTFIVSEIDLFETETETHHRALDARIHYRE